MKRITLFFEKNLIPGLPPHCVAVPVVVRLAVRQVPFGGAVYRTALARRLRGGLFARWPGGLRCAEGIDTEVLRERFGGERFERVMREAEKWIASGELRCANKRLSIPTERMLVSDAVIESLFET